MPTAVLRHAQPLLTVKAPLIAGLGTALLVCLGLGGVALFGEANTHLPGARGAVEPAPVVEAHAETADEHAGERPIRFLEPEADEDISLAGVNEGFSAPAAAAAPTEGSDPADAEARNAADRHRPVANPNALARAPLPGLTEPGPGGPLPIIAADGTRPSRAYARPFHGDPGAPTIAVVIGGMGMNATVTQAAIDELPPEVALSFAPYARDLQMWIDRARAAGHEVLIEAPMEPFDYPNNDPGPHTLLADGSAAENSRRLAWVLSRATGYFGVSNYLGARFSASPDALGQVFETLEQRGVAFLHDGAGRRSTIEAAAGRADMEYAIADRILDEDLSPDAIDQRLLALEALALQNGAALGSGFAYPATVDQIRDWTANLDLRGYQLAPPSAVMARRRLEARLAAEAQSHEPQQSAPNRAPTRTNVGPQAGGDDHAPAASSGGHH
jgi:polysaccharide deacetylase 2 family uncharacterized protein YibQ